MKIIYRMNTQLNVLQLQELVHSVCLEDVSYSVLKNTMEHSLFTIGAFDGSTLVGIIRVIGDGHHFILIQDLLVHPSYQTTSIKDDLVKRVLNRYKEVDQIYMYTQDDTKNKFKSSETKVIKRIEL